MLLRRKVRLRLIWAFEWWRALWASPEELKESPGESLTAAASLKLSWLFDSKEEEALIRGGRLLQLR